MLCFSYKQLIWINKVFIWKSTMINSQLCCLKPQIAFTNDLDHLTFISHNKLNPIDPTYDMVKYRDTNYEHAKNRIQSFID